MGAANSLLGMGPKRGPWAASALSVILRREATIEVGSTGSPDGSLLPGRTLIARTRTSDEVPDLTTSMAFGATMLIRSSPAPVGPPSLGCPPPPVPPDGPPLLAGPM